MLGEGQTPSTVHCQTVTVNIGDLAPGGLPTVELVEFLPVNEEGIITSGLPNQAQVINHSNGQFFDTFSNRTIALRLGEDYNLPVRYKSGIIYLPVVLKSLSTPQADLAITDFFITPTNPISGQAALITAVIANQGQADAGPFWVDFYISPNPAPTGPNLRWNDACGLTPCDGIAWQVAKLQAGQTITLTGATNSYDPYRTQWQNGFRVSGAHNLYLFVDSWESNNSSAGAVFESNELNNRAEITGLNISN